MLGQLAMLPIDTRPLCREDSNLVNQPEPLADAPLVASVWLLCTPSLSGPSVRLFGFTESFLIPLKLDHTSPRTALRIAAPC